MPGVMRNTHTEESAEVEVLLANMDKLKGLTKKIQGSLGRLETSGKSVQDAIRPIYGNTSKLQVTTGNIDKINVAIDNIRQPLDRRRREEDVIRAGLQRVGLHDYLASMDRTNQALSNLKNTNLRSNQEAIAELNYLLKFGSQELEALFRDTLREEANPVEPLRYITKNAPFPTISESSSSKLRLINSYVTNTFQGRRSHEQDAKTVLIYSEVRGPYVAVSLQNLATASVATVRKTDANAVYRQGTSGIGTYATALEQLFAAEYDSICPIFAREQWMRLHGLTCQDALNELSRVLGDLHGHVKSHIITDCFLAYEVIDIISNLSFRLEQKNSDLRQPVQNALRPMRELSKYSLQRLFEDSKSRVSALMTLPQDGSTVQTTYDVMTRLQIMTIYLNPLSSILASVGEGGWRASGSYGTSSPTPARLDVGVDGRGLFSAYAADTIDALLSGLDSKARASLKNTSAQGMFLANNTAVIERLIGTSDLRELLTDSAKSKIDAWQKKSTRMYTNPWLESGVHMRDVQYTNRGSNPSQRSSGGNPATVDSGAFIKGMSSKDKDSTKEKFKNFNAIFDDLVARHRTFKMEPEVRGRMTREITGCVEPMYDQFWDRYHEIDKGKGKYVKYNKAQLEAVLVSLG